MKNVLPAVGLSTAPAAAVQSIISKNGKKLYLHANMSFPVPCKNRTKPEKGIAEVMRICGRNGYAESNPTELTPVSILHNSAASLFIVS